MRHSHRLHRALEGLVADNLIAVMAATDLPPREAALYIVANCQRDIAEIAGINFDTAVKSGWGPLDIVEEALFRDGISQDAEGRWVESGRSTLTPDDPPPADRDDNPAMIRDYAAEEEADASAPIILTREDEETARANRLELSRIAAEESLQDLRRMSQDEISHEYGGDGFDLYAGELGLG